jgi:hypothetical protein
LSASPALLPARRRANSPVDVHPTARRVVARLKAASGKGAPLANAARLLPVLVPSAANVASVVNAVSAMNALCVVSAPSVANVVSVANSVSATSALAVIEKSRAESPVAAVVQVVERRVVSGRAMVVRVKAVVAGCRHLRRNRVGIALGR